MDHVPQRDHPGCCWKDVSQESTQRKPRSISTASLWELCSRLPWSICSPPCLFWNTSHANHMCHFPADILLYRQLCPGPHAQMLHPSLWPWDEVGVNSLPTPESSHGRERQDKTPTSCFLSSPLTQASSSYIPPQCIPFLHLQSPLLWLRMKKINLKKQWMRFLSTSRNAGLVLSLPN